MPHQIAPELPDTDVVHSAYRMIKDDLTLDGTPTLNLASFVTTYMVCCSVVVCAGERC